MQKLFESFRKYIKESQEEFLFEKAATNVEDFALFIQGDGLNRDIQVILYSTIEFIQSYTSEQSAGNSVKGYIEFGKIDFNKKYKVDFSKSYDDEEKLCKTMKDSDKIWAINRSAAIEKVGPMLYDIAFILAKKAGSIGLIPDRSFLSKEAEQIYVQYFNRRQGATGIDINATPLGKDCPKWGNRSDAIDYIYSTTSAGPFISKMFISHKEIIKKLSKDRRSKEEIEILLTQEGESLFDKEFNG